MQKLFLFPPRLSRLLPDLAQLFLAELRRSRLAPLEAPETAQGHGMGVLALILGLRFWLALGRGFHDEGGQLIQVAGALRLLA